ncbi:MAG: hypothetical protein AAGB31_09410 [Bdellovibrio sp.]
MQVKIYSQRDKSQTHEVAGHIYSQQERTRRALKKLGMFWGLALISVPLPVVHFVLVPVFFFVGPLMAHKTYKEEITLESTTMNCPECGKSVQFNQNSGLWPLHDFCPECRSRIYFDQA